ncbi:hypothetical protein K437DRAFT_258825 [Tilletiaria anomala UBC 951]|uniref:Uncharacterized protein n=1 Tax=Tilletiaria anomala (strain ATCC 24038 / CBS 436.72 / UBC 951) TaxID=1037660 RepID=A0A066VDY8_TILAU|nr:uncharacterized protein K437DRAFT_258825 [Tilletiaria anomala UBC 951]KDN39942.1 hypothetical protein K437DRAFT_258825 [Tilletiaria anomala UBC 951]
MESLPSELLVCIFSCSVLGLADLHNLRLAISAPRHLHLRSSNSRGWRSDHVRAQAESEPNRDTYADGEWIIEAIDRAARLHPHTSVLKNRLPRRLTRHAEPVTDISSWRRSLRFEHSPLSPGGNIKCGRPSKMWDIFSATSMLDDSALVDIADLFASLAMQAFTDGEDHDPEQEGDDEMTGALQDDPCNAIHFSLAMCLATLRALSRRPWKRKVNVAHSAQAQPAAFTDAPLTELAPNTGHWGSAATSGAAGTSDVDEGALSEEQIDTQLSREFHVLRRALRRCDPLRAHDHLRRQKQEHNPRSCYTPCPCLDRTWQSFYTIAWQFLLSRYRRHFRPDDIAHVSYRTVIFSAFCFPSSGSGGDARGHSASGLMSSTRFGFGTTLDSASSGASGGNVARNFYATAHLNPDAMLFNLLESPTYARTKEWFGISEYILPPGLARQWASWLGYDWGEGGLFWKDKERGMAERRLRSEISGTSVGASAPSCGSARSDGADVIPGFKRALRPIEVVLLTHARWRARMLLAAVAASEQRASSTSSSGREAGDNRRAQAEHVGAATDIHPEKLAQCRDMDIHFVRRSLQIQSWAIGGVTEVHPSASASAPPSGPVGTAEEEERSPLAGAVHPSSPFLTISSDDVSLLTRWRRWTWPWHLPWPQHGQAASSRPSIDPYDLSQAWMDIIAPLRPAISAERSPAPPLPTRRVVAASAASGSVHEAEAHTLARKWQNYALNLLGDLHSGAGVEHRVCSEVEDFIPFVPVRVDPETRMSSAGTMALRSSHSHLAMYPHWQVPLALWVAAVVLLLALMFRSGV